MALKITQIRGTAGANKKQKEALRVLGLRRIRGTVTRPDNGSVRGLIRQVHHLVVVDEVEGE